ncbi:hypothetical protein C8A00DRAFT_37579, partial [Chaetomidium leptoderma]
MTGAKRPRPPEAENRRDNYHQQQPPNPNPNSMPPPPPKRRRINDSTTITTITTTPFKPNRDPNRDRDRDRDRLTPLSDELLLRILSFLPPTPQHLLAVAPVSRRFYHLAADSQLWKALYYARFVLPRAL